MKQKVFNTSNKCKKYLLCFGTFLLALHLGAQSVDWETNPASPSLGASVIGILGEDVLLDLRFTYTVQQGQDATENAKSKSIQIELPAGVSIASAEKGTQGSSGANIVTGNITNSGTMYQIPITSITYNQMVHLIVRLRAAACTNPVEGTVDISLSNDATLSGSERILSLNVVKPDIVASPVTANYSNISRNTNVQYDIPISVSNGVTAKSMTITITKPLQVTLSDFQLAGSNIASASTNTTVTLNLTEAIVGTPIGSASRTLSFKARSGVNGLKTISAKVDYPVSDNCSTKDPFFTLTLACPVTQTGQAKLERYDGGTYYTTNPKTGASYPYAFNGTDATYARMWLRNSGDVDIARLRIQVDITNAFDDNRGGGYIHEGLPVYYALADAKDITVPAASIQQITNCTYSVKPTSTPLTYYGTLIQAYKDKNMRVSFDIPVEIPKEKFVHVYIPVVRGETYDASDWNQYPHTVNTNPYANQAATTTATMNIGASWDINGNTITPEGGSNNLRLNFSRFVALLPELTLTEGATGQALILWEQRKSNANYSGDKGRDIYFIRLPEYLTIRGTDASDRANYILLNNNNTASIVDGGVTLISSGEQDYLAGYNTYTFVAKNTTYSGNLYITYDAKPNGDGTGGTYNYNGAPANGVIRYWIHWDSGYDETDPTKKARLLPFHYVAKNSQNVTVLPGKEGVEINSLALKRISRGLKVKGTNTTNGEAYTPGDNDGSGTAGLAPWNVINNSVYLIGDTGRVELNVNILDASEYSYLYVLLESDYLPAQFTFSGFNSNPSEPDTYLQVNSTKIQPDVITAGTGSDGGKTVLRFPAAALSGGKFPASTGDIVISFQATAAGNPLVSFKASVYMAKSALSQPFTPFEADRFGNESLLGQWRAYMPYGAILTQVSYMSINTITQTAQLINLSTLSFEGYVQNDVWNFSNEYRPYRWLQKIKIAYPSGIVPSNLKLTASSYLNITNIQTSTITITNPEITTNGDGSITYYEYDVSDRFVPAQTFEEAVAVQSEGKWILPKDVARITLSADVNCHPSTSSTGRIDISTTSKRRPEFDSNNIISESGVYANYLYQALRCELSIPAKSSTIYTPQVVIPSVQAALSNAGANTYNTWLYVEGNVGDLAITKIASATDPSISGNWIFLGKVAGVNNYSLSYKPNNLNSAGVKVYMICDYDNASLSPSGDITTFLSSNGKYLIGSETVTVTVSTNSVLQGQITVPSTPISFATPYEVTAYMDSKSGAADVINPVITLEVPDGQELVTTAGSLQYQYPDGGNWTNIPNDAITENGNQIIINTSKFTGSDFILYGNSVSGKTDADRTLNIKLKFNPECGTSLSGFKYRFSLAGKTLSGGDAAGVNSFLSSPVYTNITSAYYFSTDIAFASNNHAFGGHTRQDTLLVTVNKYSGTGDITANDSLQVTLPRWLNLSREEDITTVTEATELTALNNRPVDDGDICNTVFQDTRTVRLRLPAAILNATGNKGWNMPFTYRIPLIYTEESKNPDLRDNPLQEIRTNVYTDKQFSGDCATLPFPLDDDKTETIALLTVKTPNPYLYNMVSLDEECNLEITSNGFDGSWYSDANLQGDPLSTTSSHSFTPTVPGTTNLYVSAIFSGDADYGKIHLPVKTPPIQLYWRKTGTDRSWLNPDNWEVISGGNSNTEGYLPALSTVVTLPSKANRYPVLIDTVACHIIRFEHGAALIRQDLLIYDSARVQLNVEANRWYMFSPPLHNMYSGDFYNTTPNPFTASEQQTTYTMLYNANNPETGSYQSGTWTGVFNTPNRPLHPGSGIAFWVDKHSAIYYTDHPEISFAFPKNDVAHYLYNPLRPAENDANISSPPMPTDRPQNGRFIYENSNGQIAADGNVTLQDMAGNTSGSILVGNPFMAHLDFFAFYQSNSAALDNRNQFKLASGVNEGSNGAVNTIYSYLKNPDNLGYISTELGTLETSGLIPPMQAFIIDVTGTSVRANISHATIAIAEVDSFRSVTSASQSQSPILQILAGRDVPVSKALVLQGEAYSTNYLPSEDSYKLFVSGMNLDPETSLDVLKPIQVYTRSRDGYALDINCIGTSEQDITVPLCVRTSEKGDIVLNFSGMESFSESTGIYLYDAQHPERLIDLKTQPEYAFEKTEDELYLENRLSLVVGKALQPLGIETASESSAVRVLSLSPRKLKIVSGSGNALGNVRITDVWGRIVLDNPAVSSSTCEYQTPAPGVYIVRIGEEIKKVVSIR